MEYSGVTWAEIDLAALASNVRALRSLIRPTVELIAVVKADAYGHGAVPVARTALRAGASRLAVHRLEEGVTLRRAGIHAPILILGYVPVAAIPTLIRSRLTPTVNTPDVVRALDAQLTFSYPVHVKVDTGLSRYGLVPEEVLPFVELIRTTRHLRLEGVYTHFATADETDSGPMRVQFQRFLDVLQTLNARGYTVPLRHACNSAATLRFPQAHLDAIRPGVVLYGLSPSTEWPSPIPLHPVLTLKSLVTRVHTLPPGTAVGYGRTFIAKKTTRVALVPIGYGDGYPRLLSNRGAVLIRGRRAPILGRVSMDQIVVDVSHIPDVRVEDPVVVIGRQGEEEIRVEEVAAWAQTINYEITTGITARVPRVYRNAR